MKYSIITLGCKVNSYESDFMREKLNEALYKEVSLTDNPHIVIINTCSVTNQSDAKSRRMIRQARKTNPNSIIIACGCSVQNHQHDFLNYGADIILGTENKSKTLEYIEECLKEKKTILNICPTQNREFEPMYLKNETNKTRAFVKIQDGCNNYCSYCIIPYLRGNIRSKDIMETKREIDNLVSIGHKEIVLTGIHTGAYGRDKDYDLVDLIRLISQNDNLLRIRISSIEITELNDKFMEELKNNPKICNHLHIPLQSGSDIVLKKMNRKYDTKYFKDKIEEIRTIRPDISITTDLIVGFPYETDEEFMNTYNFIKEISFTKIHTFPFSLRRGTLAEKMKDHFIQDSIKKDRVHKILELSKSLEYNYYSKFINQELQIITETTKDGLVQGHTSNYLLININDTIENNKLVNVKVTKIDKNNKVFGEIIK